MSAMQQSLVASMPKAKDATLPLARLLTAEVIGFAPHTPVRETLEVMRRLKKSVARWWAIGCGPFVESASRKRGFIRPPAKAWDSGY